MATNDFTDLGGNTITAVSTDNQSRSIVMSLYSCETGHFDGTGMWIEYDTPLYEEKHELIFTDVESTQNLEALVHATVESITITPIANKKNHVEIKTKSEVNSTLFCSEVIYS